MKSFGQNGKQFERKSTPDVKLGDYVPVTAQLATPPVINMNNINQGINHILFNGYIDPEYFNKDEVIIQTLIDSLFEKIGTYDNDDMIFRSLSSRLLNDISFYWGSVNNPLYVKTKQLQYFDTALTDSELETLTSWVSFQDMAEGQLYTIE